MIVDTTTDLAVGKIDAYFVIRAVIAGLGCFISINCILCNFKTAKKNPYNYLIYFIFSATFALSGTLMTIFGW